MKKLFVLAATFFLAACVQLGIVDKAYKAGVDNTVVRVVSTNPNVAAMCSGVVVHPGVVLTAAHCQFPNLAVVKNGRIYKAEKVETLGQRDIMRLTVPGLECPCAELVYPGANPQEDAVVIGFPGGALKAILPGKILGRWVLEEWDIEGKTVFTAEFLVATTHVTGGNSGGGLFIYRDGKFYLVGIVSRGHTTGVPVLAEELKAGDV